QKVATLEIQMQHFDTAQQNHFGDNLSFNPWRCLPEHRPLGGISRARRQAYRALTSFRHDRNATRHEEPSDWIVPINSLRIAPPPVVDEAIEVASVAAAGDD